MTNKEALQDRVAKMNTEEMADWLITEMWTDEGQRNDTVSTLYCFYTCKERQWNEERGRYFCGYGVMSDGWRPCDDMSDRDCLIEWLDKEKDEVGE